MSDKKYDKMSDYIESLFNVFLTVNKKAEIQQDKRLKMIALVIFNYIRKMAKDNRVTLTHWKEPASINLIPIFEYISFNNIELLNKKFTLKISDAPIFEKSQSINQFYKTIETLNLPNSFFEFSRNLYQKHHDTFPVFNDVTIHLFVNNSSIIACIGLLN
jgi:hypothetical protein